MYFVFCDLDGCITDNRARADKLPPLGSETVEDWEPFNQACGQDLPVPFMIDLINMLSSIPAVRMFYLTARPETVRAQTVNWLNRHDAPLLVPLLMRDVSDLRQNHLYKAEAIMRQLSVAHDNPLEAEFTMIDDDPAICVYIKGVFRNARILKPQTFCAAVLRRADVTGEITPPSLLSFADLLTSKDVWNQTKEFAS